MNGYARKLNNGKYRLEVSNGFRPDGKPNRASKTVEAGSDAAAERMLEDFYREFCKLPPKVNQRITFAKFVPVWQEKHGRFLSPNSEHGNNAILNARLVPYFGPVQLRKMSPSMIIDYFEELRLEGRCMNKDAKLSSGAILNIFRFLRAFLNKAVDLGYLSSNPCLKIPKDKVPKAVRKKPQILEEEELSIFLQKLFALKDTATNTKHKLFCYLSIIDGGRLGEHLSLTWDDIEMERKVIHITKAAYTDGNGNSGIKSTKTESSVRDVYIDDVVIDLLKKHKAYQEAWLAKHGIENTDGLVFLKTRLDRASIATRSMFWHWLDSFLRKNGLKHIGVHGLRRIAASYAINNNVSLSSVQAMLGHSSVVTTGIYLRSISQNRREGTERVSEALKAMINTAGSDDGQDE
ncbi:MAG: site-specific integrase [Parasporobacterium sp.]|nr:site-specific integrase [Parasporobacterium sp.]